MVATVARLYLEADEMGLRMVESQNREMSFEFLDTTRAKHFFPRLMDCSGTNEELCRFDAATMKDCISAEF